MKRLVMLLIFALGSLPFAARSENCSTPFETIPFHKLKTILQVTKNLGPQPTSIAVRRSSLSIEDYRQGLDWLLQRRYLSSTDEPISETSSLIYFTPTQGARADLFIQINDFLRSNGEGTIKKAFLQDLKSVLMVLIQQNSEGFRLERALRWEQPRLEKALGWLVRAKMVNCQSPWRIDINDIFFILPSYKNWAIAFQEMAVPDEN